MGFSTQRGPFPQTRMRRLRASDFSRRMVRESAGAIASSFAGRNRSEVRQLVTLELLFREQPVA